MRLITVNDIHTLGRTPLDEGSARRRVLYLYNTQNSQETNIRALGGIPTRNPSKRAAADQRLRPRGHRGLLYREVLQLTYKLGSNCYGHTCLLILLLDF